MISDPISSLTIVIEFAVGLVGFSGVIAVFGGRESWTGTDKFRTRNLIVLPMIPTIAAFLTIACLEHTTLITAARIGAALVFLLGVVNLNRTYVSSLRDFGVSPISRDRPVNTTLFLVYGGLIGIVLLIALNLFGQYSFFLLYLVLVAHLCFAAFNFYRLIFRPENDAT